MNQIIKFYYFFLKNSKFKIKQTKNLLKLNSFFYLKNKLKIKKFKFKIIITYQPNTSSRASYQKQM